MITVDEFLYSTVTYRDVTMGEGSEIFIVNSQGTVLSTNAPDLEIGQPYPDTRMTQHLKVSPEQLSGVFTMQQGDQSYLMAYNYSVYNDWYRVGSIPCSYLNKEAWKVQPPP